MEKDRIQIKYSRSSNPYQRRNRIIGFPADISRYDGMKILKFSFIKVKFAHTGLLTNSEFRHNRNRGSS